MIYSIIALLILSHLLLDFKGNFSLIHEKKIYMKGSFWRVRKMLKRELGTKKIKTVKIQSWSHRKRCRATCMAKYRANLRLVNRKNRNKKMKLAISNKVASSIPHWKRKLSSKCEQSRAQFTMENLWCAFQLIPKAFKKT